MSKMANTPLTFQQYSSTTMLAIESHLKEFREMDLGDVVSDNSPDSASED